jgi:membrane associated rhomboid family serine protease
VLTALLCAASLPGILSPAIETRVVPNLGFVPIIFSLAPARNFYSLVTSAFLHGDIFHLVGNLLFLWVFGRSLERLFGWWVFLIAFPLLGVAGLLVHWVLYADATSPVIGSSGAIAVLMGAYLALFPRARMRLILFLGIFFRRFWVPAWVFLLYWGGLQFFSIVFDGEAHVAYAVHAGGFVAGALAAIIWKVSSPFAEERLLEFVGQEFEVERALV